jgi:L-rhamnose mutarotase
MQRVCFLLKVRADRLEEYRGRHAAVWPEMLDALRRPDEGIRPLAEIFHLD